MKHVTLFVRIDADVPDDVNTEDLCVDLPMEDTLSTITGDPVDGYIIAYMTTDVIDQDA